MRAQLEFSGRTRRRALSALGAVAVALLLPAVSAGTAQASIVNAFPQIKGAGTISGPAYSCTNSNQLETVIIGCASKTINAGLFSTAILTLTATPQSTGHWQFVRWFGCPSGDFNVSCTMTAPGAIFQETNLNFFPQAVFDDVAGPEMTLFSSPSYSGVAERTVSFFFFADESVSSIACQMDAGPLEACSSGKTYTLPEGSHTFKVRGADISGNVGGFTSNTFRILDTAFVSGPAQSSFTNSKTAAFTYSTVAGVTFDCSLDGAAFVDCGTPVSGGRQTKSFDNLLDGTHTFRVRARDGVNFVDAIPATRSWTVDTVAPTVTGLASPTITDGIVTTGLGAVFTFGTSESPASFARFECKLDSNAFETCTSGKSYSDLSFGGHTFTVHGVDKAGNTGPDVTRSWTVAARDEDGDGFNQRSDCDDSNPAINPIAPDVPDNGIDENCDGADAVNLDRDGDGFQRPADCNDNNPAIKPGVTDIPDNGIDENCDGSDAKTPPKPRVPATVSFNFPAPGKKSTKFTVFLVKTVPAGSKIVATCKGKACGKKPPKQTINNAKGTVRLKKFQRVFKVGSVIEVRVTNPGMEGIVKQVKINKKKNPSIITKCLAGTRAVSCA